MFTSYGQYTITCIYDGSAIWTTTVEPSTPNYTFNISNLTGSSDRTVQVGDVIMWSHYKYDISEVGNTTVKCTNRVDIKGSSGTSSYTHIMYSANSDGSNMTSTPSDSTLYIGVYTGTSSTAPTTTNSYKWSRYTGQNGVSVSSVTPLYYCTSTTTTPGKPTETVTTNAVGTYNAWNKAIATYTTTNKYYFTCQEVLLSDGTRAWSDVVRDASLETANANAYSAVQTADDAKEAVRTLTQTISGVESTVNRVDKAITDKVWQTDIEQYDENTVKSIRDRVTKTETDINGITSTVSDTQSIFHGDIERYSYADNIDEDIIIPTLTTYPTTEWEDNYENHIGAVYVNSNNDICIFSLGDNGYYWKKLDSTNLGNIIVNLAQARTDIIQNANKIELVASGESLDGEILVSKIEQTPQDIKLSATKINLNGDVSVNGNNGSVNINDGVITAEKLNVDNIFGNEAVIGKIQSDSITSTHIDSLTLHTNKGTIGGFNITEDSIYSGNKSSVNSNNNGIHLNSSGELNFGDYNSFVKLYNEGNSRQLQVKTQNINIDKNKLSVTTGGDNVTVTIGEGYSIKDPQELETQIVGKDGDTLLFKVSKKETYTDRLYVKNGIDFSTIKELPRTYTVNGKSIGALLDVISTGSSS